ncbi:MAG: toll/interleukin-1 receptor domain-containing protein, partial [Armatimonadetes bacterium]|nr:toll/interleukin-1 receptor domain-containing protein [Anaerolineae bacterium]
MPHIFISYSKKDTRALALQLHDALEKIDGVTAWMDKELTPAISWAQEIQQEIDRADYVLVLLSPDVNRLETAQQDRSFVLNEVDYARQRRKIIVPVMAQTTFVPVQLAGIEYIDFSSSQEEGLRRLVSTISKRTGITNGMDSSPNLPQVYPTGETTAVTPGISISKQVTVHGAPSASLEALRLGIGALMALLVIGGVLLLIRNAMRDDPLLPTTTPNPLTEAALIILSRNAPTGTATADATQTLEALVAQILAETDVYR